jgi:hypothetical protein
MRGATRGKDSEHDRLDADRANDDGIALCPAHRTGDRCEIACRLRRAADDEEEEEKLRDLELHALPLPRRWLAAAARRGKRTDARAAEQERGKDGSAGQCRMLGQEAAEALDPCRAGHAGAISRS